jgi:hypothetical protein
MATMKAEATARDFRWSTRNGGLFASFLKAYSSSLRSRVFKMLRGDKFLLSSDDLDEKRIRSFSAAFEICAGLSPSFATRWRNHHRDLTFGLASLIMGTKFRRCTAAVFFEFFRQFPGDAHLCLGSDFNKDVEGFQQAMRRLKVDACFTTRDGAFQLRAAPAALHGQKSSKKEGISWKSGANERGKNGTRPGQDIYGEPALPTSTDETESRIRYSWHAGICHKRDGFAAGDFLDQRRRAGGFIVLMQAEHRLLDVMVEQEHGRMTRILSRNEIGFP